MKRVKIRKVCLVLLLAAATGRGLASPEAEGVPSEALMEFVGTLNALDHPRDFCLMRHGRLVKEGLWRGVIRNAGQQDELANAAAGRTQIGGLTRLLTQMAAGIAVDRGRLADDAKLEDLLRRMTADDANGLTAADELSELVEKSVGESTAAFLVANFVNRLGNPLVHNWTAQAQTRDKRLMRGGDGVDMEVRSLARIGDCLLHGGCVGKSRLLSEKWMKSHPARTVAYGGNALVLSPGKDTVLAVLTTAKDARAILAAAERLFATFSDRPLPENPAAEKRLAQTCGSLALPADKAEKSARKPSPPSFGRRHEVLLLPPRGNYKRNSEGDIVQLKDGRLMLMWSRMMGSNADDAKSHICRRHSSDGGKTWTDDEEVFETPKGSGNVMCVSLLRLQSGKIALAYLEKVSNGDCRPWFYTSSDEGKTWTDKVKVVADAYRGYYVFNNARLIQLKSGRLVYSGSSHGGKFGSAITVWLSDDEGRTWRPARNAISARKPNGDALRMEEPGSVELKDGRVMTYFRTDADWQYASYSSDGGETWGPAAPSSLRSPRSPATIERLADGRLAAVWNDHERYPQYRFLYPYHNGWRMPLTIGFSSDEGRTWTDRVDLEVDDWNCYVFVREIAGRLYIGYCCGDGMRTMRVIATSADELRGSLEKPVSAASATSLDSAIAAKHRILTSDKWGGGHRIIFDFNGRKGWIVEPENPAPGKPWIWTMQWMGAFMKENGSVDLVEKRGLYHVHLEAYDTRADERGLKILSDFQDYLVGELGFAPKARLVGMSWGGFYSIRYAARHPDRVDRIYLDAPLLNVYTRPKLDAETIGPWSGRADRVGDGVADPEQALNLAEPIVRAKIPIYLVYGGKDASVDPKRNCEPFIAKLEKCGGRFAAIRCDPNRGHHPHGPRAEDFEDLIRFLSKERVDVDVPRVWTTLGGVRTAAEFEKAVIDCKAHGVDVMECGGGDEATLRERLAICRRYGMKAFIGVEDACRNDPLAKKTGKYELAVMSGGCYRGLAIDRNLFSFTPGRHEIIVEPPVYSKGQAYAKHPHYYMLGQGHYYGGYVPTGRAEIVVPEKAFDGRQHLRIVPARVELAPEGTKPENDSAAAFADSDEVRARKLVKLSFDLTGLDGCRLDKVGIAVYWKFDDSDPKWQSNRTSYSLFSPVTRERMRGAVRTRLGTWTRANGGTFPSDVVVAVRLGDEIFNATGWLGCPAASFPLWDYSASALAAFAKATPAGVVYPRTLGAEEFYGSDSYAQFLYLFHRAAADYLKGAVEEAHAVSPSILAFRNTTRGGVWDYGNDHDGTGQELLTQVLDFVHLDPYPLTARGYADDCIPFDMAYLSGLARRYGKPIVPWMQAHSFPACGIVHPTAKDVRRMYEQHLRFEPDGMMWLGYKPGKRDCTFPDSDPLSWEEAERVHAEFKRLARRSRKRAELAVVRPYSARAVVGVDGRGASADEKLRDFVRDWSVRLGREYDVFEVPPFQTAEERAALAKELKGYRKVVSSVDWPGAENVAAARPKPTPPLQKRLKSGDDVIGIVHFTVNTFTDREWGYGSEDPEVFNPTAFDAEQIVGACAAGGIRGLVIVAKHHDGFCLWPTKTTGHNISKSPFRGGKGDYVKEMSEACRKFGVKFGVYCSPWDRNNAEYARPKYVETYHEQIRELTGGAYGPIFELWLDGANGGDGYYGGAWEKRSIKDGYYRFEDVVKFVRGHNPDLTIFGFGGEFCWPGNESGVVDPDSGCTRGRGFRPWEADFPLRPGWFYHQSQDGFSRSGEFLMKVYLRTVGNAATMDIGISPDRRGLLTDEDVGSLRRFGELRKTFFSREVPSCAAPFNLIAMEEDVANGERVDEWRVTLDGKELVRGGKIGFKRFRTLPKPVCGKELKLEIVRGPAKPQEIGLKLYSVDPELMAKVMASEEPKRPPAPFELRGVLSVRKRDELTFMVKHPRKIHALTLTPDKAALGGTPVVFRLSYSVDGEKWADDPAEYRLDNVAANPIPQTVALKGTAHVKYVRIRAVRTLAENQTLSLAGVELVP